MNTDLNLHFCRYCGTLTTAPDSLCALACAPENTTSIKINYVMAKGMKTELSNSNCADLYQYLTAEPSASLADKRRELRALNFAQLARFYQYVSAIHLMGSVEFLTKNGII